jgi:hypothetical protein
MKGAPIVMALSSLVACATGVYAACSYGGAREVERERESAERDLDQALRLIAQHPALFRSDLAGGGNGELKGIAQESASQRGVAIGYLSESEREVEKGRRERQVVIRLTNAPHPNLVLFLQELERRGAGCKVKEVHVRPSQEIPDAYEEAEIVLTKTLASAGKERP